ncbi:DNA invertase Pin-like site-specific DNA recombinase [Lacinutrix venerupis]|uniref:recombinase family protein n=1 Tax=Lacinutrix venerupis TaxID=1486034 RepID=UPI000EAEEA02|nr:recombinase family protein [Lacinutrix venerupis]RLJ60918.1 DNA invertase Pin-like site-specific DNA recombinase [Lacinutrix venerupis]
MLGIYCRTSKNRAEKYTIENQREGGIKCAIELGLEYIIYIDDGISGTLDESVRDGLSDLFRDIRKNKITHIYCIDQSRIERDTRTWDFFVAECLNKEIKYYPNGSFFALDNPTNRMFASLMSVVNAYYAEITSKKVRLANARKAKEGKTHGIKPYGYTKGINNEYKIEENEAVHVKRMFKLSLDGIGAYTIANILNEEGIPTKFSKNFKGKIKRKDEYTGAITYHDKSTIKWRGNVISDILRNKIYKGIREWNRNEDKIENINGKPVKTKVKVELITSKVPHIIEPELWDKVQANLSVNKKNVGKKSQYNYLLNGLVKCHHCERLFVGKRRKGSRDNSYKCKGKVYPNSNCDKSRSININKLDTFIIKHLFISKSLKGHLDSLPKTESKHDRLKIKLDEEKSILKKIEKKLDKGYKLLFNEDSGFKDDEVVQSNVLKLKNKKKEKSEVVTKLEQELLLAESSFRDSRTERLLSEYTDESTFDDIKRIIHSLIDYIKIEHHKEEGKMGTFLLNIKYKGYDEVISFMTNWHANKWYWISKYRKGANTPQELEDDREMDKALLKQFGMNKDDIELTGFQKESGLTDDEIAKMNPFSSKYEGAETKEFIYDLIELKTEEIIDFN